MWFHCLPEDSEKMSLYKMESVCPPDLLTFPGLLPHAQAHYPSLPGTFTWDVCTTLHLHLAVQPLGDAEDHRKLCCLVLIWRVNVRLRLETVSQQE